MTVHDASSAGRIRDACGRMAAACAYGVHIIKICLVFTYVFAGRGGHTGRMRWSVSFARPPRPRSKNQQTKFSPRTDARDITIAIGSGYARCMPGLVVSRGVRELARACPGSGKRISSQVETIAALG
jgi:hypothetical protein